MISVSNYSLLFTQVHTTASYILIVMLFAVISVSPFSEDSRQETYYQREEGSIC